MKLDNQNNYLPEKCSNLNIKLFVLYAKAQLNREEERLIDTHCGRCDDCRANLAYVYEIVKGNEQLSIDGQTLLLKYLNDPIYKHFIENFKDAIRQEILDEIRLLLVDRIKDSDTVNLTIQLNSDTSNNNAVNNSNQPNRTLNKTFNKTFYKSFNKTANKITNIKLNYSYFISIFLVVVFVSLSIFTYLAINPNPNQQANNPINSLPTTITNIDNQASNNLYQQLDIAIDQYLNLQNIEDLNKAQLIAKDIEQKYNDSYAIALVAYYQAVPKVVLEKLLVCRKQMLFLIKQPSGDNYQHNLEESKILEKQFIELGDIIESYRVKALINKLYVKTFQYSLAKDTTKDGLSFTNSNNYIFLKGHFLLWQAKYLSGMGDFTEATEALKEVISLGERLEVGDFIFSSVMSLAALYNQANEDQLAFELSQKYLNKIEQKDTEYAITLMHLVGLSAFNLGYDELANQYLRESIKSAEQLNNPAALAMSYVFLALTLSYSKDSSSVQDLYLEAEKTLDRIKSHDDKLRTKSVLLGYQAKTSLLQGNFKASVNSYQQKLEIMQEIGSPSNLEISQTNEGLAIALQNLGETKNAQHYLAIASHYQQLANTKKERNNCLLAYVPKDCK